ncbi:hypothetical protein HK405_003962 [Cladochytrium tenue]|nr:hypothetical protein HK405_003962 [Cladochytrium tenue]
MLRADRRLHRCVRAVASAAAVAVALISAVSSAPLPAPDDVAAATQQLPAATLAITKAGRTYDYRIAAKRVAAITAPTFTKLTAEEAAADAAALAAATEGSGLARRGGTAPLVNDGYNFLWNAPVTFGNGQSFSIDLDTGSSDTWVQGDVSPAFNTSDPSVTSLGFYFLAIYGSGIVIAEVYEGPVSIAGISATVDFGVSLGEAGFSETNGLLGLGFTPLSSINYDGGTKSNFMDQAGIGAVGFYLNNNADGDEGEVALGAADPDKYDGSFTYVPLTAETYWQASWAGGSFAVAGTTVSGSLGLNVTSFIVDTGTSLIYLEQAVADAINAAIGGTYSDDYGAYVIDCSVASTGPDVELTFGGSTFSIPASIYVLPDNGVCFSGIDGQAESISLGIVGDVFIRAYYTLFDKSNLRVGFAKAVHP